VGEGARKGKGKGQGRGRGKEGQGEGEGEERRRKSRRCKGRGGGVRGKRSGSGYYRAGHNVGAAGEQELVGFQTVCEKEKERGMRSREAAALMAKRERMGGYIRM